MRRRPGSASLARCALLNALLLAGSVVSAQEPVRVEISAEFLRGLVTAAEWTFEDAEAHLQVGRRKEALILFQRAYRILTEADQLNADTFSIGFSDIYSLMFLSLAELDPKARDRIRAISEQSSATYASDPVDPGRVDYFIRVFTTTKADFMCRSLDRSLRHIPLVREIFTAHGIRADLAYMALVESGFRHSPTSHAGAQGMWQFMPATARDYGLRVDDEVDERNDPEKSTQAAAAHLKRLHRKFDDWPLVVAAYNVGEGRIERLLRRHGVSTYRELTDRDLLPEETERYVPAIVAATLISRDPVGYGLGTPGSPSCGR